MASKTKTCKALVFPKATTETAILAACKKEWMKRYINKDGTAKANRWAPIYLTRDGQKMSVRLDGKNLILSGELARTTAPASKTVWSS
jgi:hypothetical protein